MKPKSLGEPPKVKSGTEDGLCRCGNDIGEEHVCPYSYEMGGETTCNCCEKCTHRCAMDI